MNRPILLAALVVATIFVALVFVGPPRSHAARFPDPAPTLNSAFLLGAPTVNGSPLQAGDEIAVYSVHPSPGAPGKWERTIICHAVQTDNSGLVRSVPAYGDDSATADAVEGAVPGEEISLLLWRAAEGKTYSAYIGRDGNPVFVIWPGNLADISLVVCL